MRNIVLWIVAVALLVAINVTPRAQDAPTVAGEQLAAAERVGVTVQNLLQDVRTAIAERDACRSRLAPLEAQAMDAQLQAHLQELVAAVEAGHPGKSWDPRTGVFTVKASPGSAGAAPAGK